MQTQFYKANPKGTGAACQFYLSSSSIMLSMIKQDSWDAEKKKGDFKKNKNTPTGSLFMKLTRVETAGLIRGIERCQEWSCYHRSPTQEASLKLTIWRDDESGGSPKGYGITGNKKVTTTERAGETASFFVTLTLDEARLLKSDLESFLYVTLQSTGHGNKTGKTIGVKGNAGPKETYSNRSNYQQ